MNEELKNCTKCQISNTRKHIIIPDEQRPNLSGMLITDAPTSREDTNGKLQDTYWKTVDSLLTFYGYPMKNFYITAAVKCCPEINRFPNDKEIENCSPYLLQEILFVKPKAIIFFGESCARFYIQKEGTLINKCFQTRLCPFIIVADNPKSIRKGTDKYVEFKGLLRRFIAICLNP